MDANISSHTTQRMFATKLQLINHMWSALQAHNPGDMCNMMYGIHHWFIHWPSSLCILPRKQGNTESRWHNRTEKKRTYHLQYKILPVLYYRKYSSQANSRRIINCAAVSTNKAAIECSYWFWALLDCFWCRMHCTILLVVCITMFQRPRICPRFPLVVT